jgi:hypothetical protein
MHYVRWGVTDRVSRHLPNRRSFHLFRFEKLGNCHTRLGDCRSLRFLIRAAAGNCLASETGASFKIAAQNVELPFHHCAIVTGPPVTLSSESSERMPHCRWCRDSSTLGISTAPYPSRR